MLPFEIVIDEANSPLTIRNSSAQEANDIAIQHFKRVVLEKFVDVYRH